MIVCPKCGKATTVTETRPTNGGSRRRRRCIDLSCNARLTTFEFVVPTNHQSVGGEPTLLTRKQVGLVRKALDQLRDILERSP